MTGAKRNTWQREAVRGALGEASGFVSAQELYGSLREGGSSIGLATVYRTLSVLQAEGEADSLQSPEGEALYRAWFSGGHHTPLIGRDCGRTVGIEADAVESWAQQVAAGHGFTRPQHVVDVFGLCADCSRGV